MTTGLQFDATAMAHEPLSIVLIPVLVALFLVARALPALVYRGLYDTSRLAAAGLLQATSLSVPVVAVRIGTQLHTIDADTAAAIIAAGLITVLVFPPFALMLISRTAPERGS